MWKHARANSLLTLGKDPVLPSSYKPISLKKILLSRITAEIKSRGLLRDEQFGFRPGLSTTLPLAGLVERVKINFDEKRLTSVVFLDMAKAFDSVKIEGLLFKLAIFEFPS